MIEPWTAILIAFGHGCFVVIGIYVAIATRLAKLEAKMDVIWQAFLLEKPKRRDDEYGG